MAQIERLLIANRGEIACRVIRTAKSMGIHTIAVYSAADSHAMHVGLADEARLIGEAPPAESYLNTARILDAAVAAGADAIHSGYGFLAENPAFAADCASRGLIFVGPPPDAISAMGQKGNARRLMRAAGVPVLPGIDRIEGDVRAAANEIGYPLMIKPEAGGGGKGMKIVWQEAELEAALDSARREAKSAFGDASLMLERYLTSPRHIELQVFADSHGHCLHLNERDCSLQRRHQKIVEESPAPGLSAALREAMGGAAVAAAQAIGYVGAGTVEFLLDRDDNFYFMEMNTRLQVEHPVTEAVTGFDLVAWQLRIAAGEPLPVTADDVPIMGHAIEARLYAEDPLNDFLPVSGRVRHLQLPMGRPGIRIDNGVLVGDHIGVYYDPMLMKIIAHGDTRNEALDRLRLALAETRIAGIRTNRDFLCHILDHASFRAGGIATDFLDSHLADVFTEPGEGKTRAHICAAVLAFEQAPAADVDSPWHAFRNFRLNSPNTNTVLLTLGNRGIEATVEQRGEVVLVGFDGRTSRCRPLVIGEAIRLECDGETFEMHGFRHDHRLTLVSHSRVFEFSQPLEEAFVTEQAGNVQAPMSGRIVAIETAAGNKVAKGEPLVVIEAMKMEHTIRAPDDGRVIAVYFSEGDLVDEGCELLEFSADTDA